MTFKNPRWGKALDLTWPLGQALNTPRRDTPVPQEHGAPGLARMFLTWFLPAGETSAWLESSERQSKGPSLTPFPEHDRTFLALLSPWQRHTPEPRRLWTKPRARRQLPKQQPCATHEEFCGVLEMG